MSRQQKEPKEVSIRYIKKIYGFTQEQIDEARLHQEHQRRAGMPVQSIAVQLGIEPPRRTETRLSDAIGYNRSPKTDTIHPNPIRYDFFRGGNVSLGYEYIDTMTDRLFDQAPTETKAREALAVLGMICRHMAWESYECTKNAKELSRVARMQQSNLSVALALLEQVGAIKRIRQGNSKIIAVTPEGAYRGKIEHHHKVAERHKLDVIEGGLTDS